MILGSINVDFVLGSHDFKDQMKKFGFGEEKDWIGEKNIDFWGSSRGVSRSENGG